MFPGKTQLYSGTSGIVLPVNKSQYPEEFKDKTRLHYYASLFNSIEINSTFYNLPQGATVLKWAESVPDYFRFTFKISKSITHVAGLNFSTSDVNNFMEVVDNCKGRKGCLLAQFPPSLKVDSYVRLNELLELLNAINLDGSWQLAFEFRDESCYISEVYELLEEYKAALVLHDMPDSATPLNDIRGEVVYFRFHGPEPRYRGDYSDTFLERYASFINTLQRENKTVYAYFNNTVGAAFSNLKSFNDYI